MRVKYSSDVIIRNNLVYAANSCGISVGGYAKSGTGGSTNITIVNNSLYDNDTKKTAVASSRFSYAPRVFCLRNNIVYTGSGGPVHLRVRIGQRITANLQRLLYDGLDYDV